MWKLRSQFKLIPNVNRSGEFSDIGNILGQVKSCNQPDSLRVADCARYISSFVRDI